MQRWGFTNRNPSKLFLTRANKPTEQTASKDTIDPVAAANQFNPFPSRIAEHPATVRKREIHIQETKSPGESLKERSSYVNISTVGQTFLDMLQKPELCGGMAHVIEVWQEHAANYFSEIVDVIDRASSNLVKSRAGYILEAQLGLRHDKFENWKTLGQRGGSRKLDPTKPFAPTFSETWMISINV
jgi:predicted transcriptional regulator of viral defense system